MKWPTLCSPRATLLTLAALATACLMMACRSEPVPTVTPVPPPPPTPASAPAPTRAVDPLPDSPAEWESWEKVKGDLTAMGLEPGEPFVGVFGGGTYDNVVAYALLFSCEEDGPSVGPTVMIREDWPLGFME